VPVAGRVYLDAFRRSGYDQDVPTHRISGDSDSLASALAGRRFTLDAEPDGDPKMTLHGDLDAEAIAHAVRLGAVVEKVRDGDGYVTDLRLIWPGLS
jgi:hypothetical protein